MKIQSRFLDGIPTFFIVDLEDFERQFQIKRDQTTDSIWNADHLENRLEVFEESEGGISYRLKCICQEDSAHNLDPYCPRNIPSEPKEESSGSDSESETEEDGRVRREKEKKKKMRQNREEAIKAIMELVGLSNVKEHVEKLLVKAKTMARQGIDIKDERYGTVLIGNSGTGKTTFAKQYAKLLHSMGVIGSEQVKHTTGIYLADGGISRIKGYIEDLVESNGGVLFIDDAHYLLNDEHNGIRVLDYLLGEVDSRRGKAVFIFAGKEKEMMDVLGHGDKNLSSLLPYHIRFKDYTDEELREILWYSMKKKFDGKAEVEGGKEGLYMRIATRRLGRTRGSTLFANARSVNNLLSQILDRQAARLSNTRAERITAAAQDAKLPDSPSNSEGKESVNEVQDAKSSEDKDVVAGNIPAESHRENTWGFVGTRTTEELTPTKLEEQIPATEVSNSLSATAEEETKSDDNLDSKTEAENKNDDDTLSEVDSAEEEDYKFTKEDIIGPNPSAAVLESPAWQKMQRLTGLESVKDSILGLLELVKTNYDRELEEKVPLKVSLNRLFLGPPGTGKTLVAKLYGQLLAEIGILSKGDVIMKNPSDLIGRYIGDSENNTRAALRSAMGNVLVIDEAYMMYSGGDTGNESDSFRQGIMDTLVGEIQSEPGEDRCVLLLGYDDAMSEMLQNSNPGLNRRFPMSDAFWFQNFTLPELECILKSKLEDHVLEATEPAIKVAMDVLEKASSRVNFGNGGEVENLITKAKINYQKRVSSMPVPDRPKTWIFAPQDFDPEFDRGKSATNNLKELFKDVIGCEDIISKLEQYQRISQVMKLKGLDPKDFIPTNFVFKGPPGTGKTTTARKIAQVYYDMGHLADPSVIECSASDLVGKYVGQSAPKTAKVFERALGRVLFIDEAYRLISSPDSCSFNSEVVSELVDLLTKPKYHGKLIVILAGYTAEMNTLLSTNPGLASRFPEEIHFPSLGPDHCLEILKRNLGKNGVSCPVLGRPSLSVCKNLMRKMRFLGETKGWGNARDVETLGKNLIREAFGKVKDVEDDLICTAEMVGNAMDNMLKERRARGVVLQREREERVVDVGCEDY
ncbi:P-loop containing nucleoside triphosphate hydrolase protein [Mollisia scopiformis]|uniref:p-loop containing nucleoside triphosphate hydrolase protein n=1 Tax=Mollisia scopiformis TaxID=149040 RepID=A0A194XM88_MOLSC|nr:P-loop containing nucleoside triphosphate hydrolase protein [Mollisia scopiformis]KUJ21293.1 P-loop containing nucleoside triphosphate hydrolase protein [Mollisia scopiformis]